MTPTAYADMTDVALRTDAGQSVAPDLPEYEPIGTLDAVVASLGAMGDKPPAPPIAPDEPIVALRQQARSTVSPASTVAADHSTAPDTIDVVGCAAPVKNIWVGTRGASSARQ